MHVPEEGEFLTDGKRLVEVLGKDRDGIKILDATVPLVVGVNQRDPRATEVLSVEEAVKHWRVVRPDDGEGAHVA